MNFKKFIFVFIFLSIIFISNNAFACSCAFEQTTTLQEDFDNAGIVFLGNAINVQSNVVEGKEINGVIYPGSFGETKTTFNVKKIWKGPYFKILTTGGAFGGTGSCSTGFSEGKDYLIFANVPTSQGEIGTSICSRIKVIENESTDPDIIALGNPIIDLSLFVPVVLIIVVFGILFVYRNKFLKK